MAEIFDVVDENDNVIDQQLRHIVHQKKLLHRSVHALVFDESYRMYIQKRSMSKDTNPGLWDTSVGGHVDSGESYDKALIRETQEELGIVLTQIPPRLFKLSPCEDTGYEFIWIYKIVHDGEVIPCPIEISEGRWVDYQELLYWIQQTPALFTSSLLMILNQLESSNS